MHVHRKDDFSLDPERATADVAEHRPDIVFLCSPNNPTGTALDPRVVDAVIEAAPGMVVVDGFVRCTVPRENLVTLAGPWLVSREALRAALDRLATARATDLLGLFRASGLPIRCSDDEPPEDVRR